jgi:hypothetical protein
MQTAKKWIIVAFSVLSWLIFGIVAFKSLPGILKAKPNSQQIPTSTARPMVSPVGQEKR